MSPSGAGKDSQLPAAESPALEIFYGRGMVSKPLRCQRQIMHSHR